MLVCSYHFYLHHKDQDIAVLDFVNCLEKGREWSNREKERDRGK